MSEPFVYFIKPIGMDGPIKIGTSRMPEDRLIALSVWSPFPLEIIGTAPGTSKEESILHKRFAKLHTHGEWFMSSLLLRQTIEKIIAGQTIRFVCSDLPSVGVIRNQTRKPSTPDRIRFLEYGRRIKKATRPLYNKEGSWFSPPDVRAIMTRWTSDWSKKRAPIAPTEAELQRLEEFIANPKEHCVFLRWGSSHSSKRTFDEILADAWKEQTIARSLATEGRAA